MPRLTSPATVVTSTVTDDSKNMEIQGSSGVGSDVECNSAVYLPPAEPVGAARNRPDREGQDGFRSGSGGSDSRGDQPVTGRLHPDGYSVGCAVRISMVSVCGLRPVGVTETGRPACQYHTSGPDWAWR